MTAPSRTVLIAAILIIVAISVVIGISLAFPNPFLRDDSNTDDKDGNGEDAGTGDSADGGFDENCQRQTIMSVSTTESAESDSIENTNDSSEQIIIGNPVGVERLPGITIVILEEPEQKVSFRFTSKYTGEIESLAINLLDYEFDNRSKIQAGLQADDNGEPSGVWIGRPGHETSEADRNSFVTIELEQSAPLLKGRVYHLVIQTTELAVNTNEHIPVKMYNLHAPAHPLNEEDLDVTWPDEMMNTLYYDGASWEERNDWPIFVVKFADGRTQGQPYSLAAPWVIYGERYVGQEIVPTTNYVAEKFGFSVAAMGEPSGKLCYEVRDSDNNILAGGLFVERDELTQAPRFVEVSLDSPLFLDKDKPYRFVLYSLGTELKEPYHIYGHEFTYDNLIGYGGLRNVLTISYDAGSTWKRWDDADTIFTISGR
jgi:hypothetical protein